jgi:alpha-glucosidase
LGLTQVDIAFADLRDPEAIANWPLTLSRDGARTPMPWVADAPHGGFTTGTPWLPAAAAHRALAVDRQEADPDSLLHLTRRLVRLRRDHPALATGNLTLLAATDTLLAFERAAGGQTLQCVFNFSAAAARWQAGDGARWRVIESVNQVRDRELGPFGALVAIRKD